MLRGNAPSLAPFLLLLCCGTFAVGTAGCSGGGGAKLVQVEGKIMLGDKPLPTGFVIFYPDAAKGNASKEEPRADIEPQGTYTLLTGRKKGVAPGWYKVAVTAAEQLDPKNPYFSKWLIPEKYIDPRTSKLTVEVVESPAPGAYDFKLEPK